MLYRQALYAYSISQEGPIRMMNLLYYMSFGFVVHQQLNSASKTIRQGQSLMQRKRDHPNFSELRLTAWSIKGQRSWLSL